MSAVGITQSELARRVKVTQGAIAKIAKNNPNGSSHLHRIARILRTTTAYLEGEIDDPTEGAAPEAPVDDDVREISDRFAGMLADDRRALLRIVRTMTGAGGSPTPVSAAPVAAISLPSEPALAQMFEGLLEGIAPKTSLIERAQLLAKRLPIGLSQLCDVLPDADIATPAAGGRTRPLTPAKRHREPL